MRMAVEASDPDFKLASVKLMAQRNGQPLLSKELLPAAAAGPFQRRVPIRHEQLEAGGRRDGRLLGRGRGQQAARTQSHRNAPLHAADHVARATAAAAGPTRQGRSETTAAKAQRPPRSEAQQSRKKGPTKQGDQPSKTSQKGEGKPGEGRRRTTIAERRQRDQQHRDQQPQEEAAGRPAGRRHRPGRAEAGDQKPDRRRQKPATRI